MALSFVLWSFYATVLFATAVILLIGFFRFRSIMHLPVVERRYPKIVLLEGALSVVAMAVLVPIRIIVAQEVEEFRNYFHILHIVVNCLGTLLHLIVYCEACRIWLICYDLHYLRHLQNNSWKLPINSSFGDNNWWLTHRQTFGNCKYVQPRMLCCGVIGGLIASALFQIFGFIRWVQLVDFMIYGFPVMLIFGAYYKCPKLANDRYMFLLEAKYSVILYIVALLLYGFGTLLSLFYFHVGEAVVVFAAWIAFSWVSFLSTVLIPNQILSKKEWSDITPNENNASEKLFEIFACERRLDAFASHLNCEFASESLLAFIEFIQFKQYFRQMYFAAYDDTVQLPPYQIRFNFGEQPLQSEIVFQTVQFDYDSTDETNKPRIMEAFKTIAFLLFDRYILEGSAMEVNLASEQRMRYNQLMQNEAQWLSETDISAEELACLFDTVCLELYKLMNDASQRFKKSDENMPNALQSVSIISHSSTSAIQ